jgi:hypothetical protein
MGQCGWLPTGSKMTPTKRYPLKFHPLGTFFKSCFTMFLSPKGGKSGHFRTSGNRINFSSVIIGEIKLNDL